MTPKLTDKQRALYEQIKQLSLQLDGPVPTKMLGTKTSELARINYLAKHGIVRKVKPYGEPLSVKIIRWDI